MQAAHVLWSGVLLGTLLITPAAAAVDRVVIFDVQTDGVSGSDVVQLPDLLGQIIASHQGFEAVPDAETHRALLKQQAQRPDCAESEACRWSVVKDLHARYMVHTSVVKRARTYTLYVSLTDVAGGAAPAKALETMKLLKSLQQNAKLCLDRLFQWKDAPASVSSEEPSKPAAPARPTPSAEAIAPIPEPVAVPPPAPVAAAAPKKPKDNRPVLALLSVKAGQGFTAEELSSVEEGLLGALEETQRFRVVGRTDIATLLDLEAKKQIAGCDEDTGCMTAIAGSLGADYVASANVGRLGTAIQLTFKVIETRRAMVLVHARQTVDSDSQLIAAADEISDQVVLGVFGPGTPRPVHKKVIIATKEAPPPRAWTKRDSHGLGIATTVLGGVGLVVATVLGVVSHNDLAAANERATASLPSQISKINSTALGADSLWGIGGAAAAAGIGVTVAF